MILCEGNMLANALLCPDMMHAKSNYENVTFYFDTRILLSLLRLDTNYRVKVSFDLIDVLIKLKAKLCYFSHSLIEVENIILGASHNVSNQQISYPVLTAARQRRMTSSDLFLLSETVRDELNKLNISLVETPKYNGNFDFQIDEHVFDNLLEKEISYFNPKAKDNDINSVRSVYCFRKDIVSKRIEDCGFIFVTTNSAYALSADIYNKSIDTHNQISPVITDYSLMNVSWLKLPLEATNIPQTELISLIYSALEPPIPFMNKVLEEIDKLVENGQISADIHQLLRTKYIIEELYSFTTGDKSALTEQTILNIVENIKDEGRKETKIQVDDLTQKNLLLRQKNERHKERLKSQINSIRKSSRIISNLLAFLCLIFSISLNIYCVCIESSLNTILLAIINFFYTFKYKNIYNYFYIRLLKLRMKLFKQRLNIR